MAKKVTVWEAIDGYQLPSEEEAKLYEDNLKLQDYIDDNPLYGQNSGCRIDGAELLLWVKQHKRIFITLLPEEDEDD